MNTRACKQGHMEQNHTVKGDDPRAPWMGAIVYRGMQGLVEVEVEPRVTG
jgi:hypothetical protein